MKPEIFIFCLGIVLTAGSQENDSDQETFTNDDVASQLIEHYNQIDLVPYVPTEKAREEARKAVVFTSAAFIYESRFSDAKKLVKGIRDANLIPDTVITAYDGDLVKTIKIITFLNTLDDKTDQMKGYSALYDEMKRRKDMENPAIIEIAYWMQHHLEEVDLPLETDEFPERFYFFDSEKHSIITDAMEHLARKIKKGDDSEVVMLSKSFPGALAAVLPRLVQTTYDSNVGNFNYVMEVANDELTPRHREIVLDTLLTEMYRNNHLGDPKFQILKNTINTSPAMTLLKKKVANIGRNNQ